MKPPRTNIAHVSKDTPILDLTVTLDVVDGLIQLQWRQENAHAVHATLQIRCTGFDELTWDLQLTTGAEQFCTSQRRSEIRSRLGSFSYRFPANVLTFKAEIRGTSKHGQPSMKLVEPIPAGEVFPWIEENIHLMAKQVRFKFSPLGRTLEDLAKTNPEALTALKAVARREAKIRQRLAPAEVARQRAAVRRPVSKKSPVPSNSKAANPRPNRKMAPDLAAPRQPTSGDARPDMVERSPVPPVAIHFDPVPYQLQATLLPVTELRGYFLRERAAQWWISNQSDNLLALPHCRIQHLEYQIRTALRVLGPLRGRALLSDEVGLGKTIEAGLVLKEGITRGLVRRALILTVPSLVDQWEEELADKFNLAAATTNQPSFRADPESFWQENPIIIASLHTLKQPAHLAVAQTVKWDFLAVDEAHYLRNRESQAWQAVNALPRQFLLLLTATPVQNSLEELYNLITLLQPGQLPSPKEFRARFLDSSKPTQPRHPEELRRLLGQVMIRNTRANAGIHLPPRRAETVLFEPDPVERVFWLSWESEFRAKLKELSPSQASLWGRILLQAAGSSPYAWRKALGKFPDTAAAERWIQTAPLEASWTRKCNLLPPLTRAEGGAVIFTQFLETQAAMVRSLTEARVPVFVINGQTPAPERQPITEAFRKAGGALLLTHSGTEGRNLQFSHHLVNFDLPWNPMEIEQRIGRLHRLGQRSPVRIHNLVQSATLQEHLLHVLQEKLNLFELVVGETGLILGDRFSSDEFAEEILRRWRESEGRVAEAIEGLGDQLAAAHAHYQDVKQLDASLFAQDFESL